MNRNAFAFAIIRLLGLIMMIIAIMRWYDFVAIILQNYIYLRNALPNNASSSLMLLFASSFVVALLVSLLGVWLWFKADAWSQRILPKQQSENHDAIEQESTLKVADFYRLGLVFIGIVLLVQALPSVAGNIVNAINYYRLDRLEGLMPAAFSIWVPLASNLTKLLIAAALILRTEGFTHLLMKLRALGLKEKP